MQRIKIKIVIFDGISGAGKTTLRYKLFQKFEFNILTIDRFTPSTWAYDYLRGVDRTAEVSEIEIKFNMFDCSLVLCYCSPETSRMRVRNDKLRKVIFSPENEYTAFKKYELISLFNSRITLDTDVLSVEESLNKICRIL